MTKRMRSPNYPSMPLGEAIEIAGKMFNEVRGSAVEREVAARAMGYNGLTGRSGKVLSNLIQYGLLQKAGKNEVRLSSRAVEVLHPDSEASRARAVQEAAFEPELFQELRTRFDEGVLSENAIRSYLLKRGFTDVALQPAIRAYVETHQFVQQFAEYESYGQAAGEAKESASDQSVSIGADMRTTQPAVQKPHVIGSTPIPPDQTTYPDSPRITSIADDDVLVVGHVRTKEDAERIIRHLNFVKSDLPSRKAADRATPQTEANTISDSADQGEAEDDTNSDLL